MDAKTSTLQQIEQVIERDVRPSLFAHEGNVRILSYEDGILRVRLTGHCAGCPSAQLTTEEIIAKTVRDQIPEVKDVILVTEVSGELLDMARRLLNHQALA